ncbi:MAG TPA: sulfatase-like hydrolase/transferase, partial [Casimicrobiaceae bacterium]|nr:sulfatase-like hydrolase/transferase [Casimicrobiaceae bacterium]
MPDGAAAVSEFEPLLAELPARFLTLPANAVDGAIDDALLRVAVLIGADHVRAPLATVESVPSCTTLQQGRLAQGDQAGVSMTSSVAAMPLSLLRYVESVLDARQRKLAGSTTGSTVFLSREKAVKKSFWARSVAVGIVSAITFASAIAQQITGVPGSPSATTTLQGNQLPPPPPKFGGVINENAKDSKPWWPPRVVPPKGAPNVLLIMTDDQGYGVSSTFGGVIPTPNMDRLAKVGLRYTQFHSTALCSPTRAAIITGRNHHSTGYGQVSEFATGYPGYDSIMGPENATIGRILSDNGYATSWFGKNHNTPAFQYSAAGPFDQWPSGMGFQYFYGFMGGESDQWTPYLFRDHSPVYPWIGKPGYNLVTDMADDAIRYMKEVNASAPEKPFFVYYVPGATHSPHQPTKEWIAKFKGKFDMGW